jgi:hypothetical protein
MPPRVPPKKTGLGEAAVSAIKPIAVPPVATPPVTVDRPMSPKEIANFLRVSPATIRRNLTDIPHFTVGKRIRFLPKDVLEHFRGKYGKKP